MLVHESVFGALRWIAIGSFVVAVLATLRFIAAVGSRVVNPPQRVAPNATTIVDHVIHLVGPNDPPPPEVKGFHSENRYWLTW